MPAKIATENAISAGEGSCCDFVVIELPIEPIQLNFCPLGIRHRNQSAMPRAGLITEEDWNLINMLKVIEAIQIGRAS